MTNTNSSSDFPSWLPPETRAIAARLEKDRAAREPVERRQARVDTMMALLALLGILARLAALCVLTWWLLTTAPWWLLLIVSFLFLTN